MHKNALDSYVKVDKEVKSLQFLTTSLEQERNELLEKNKQLEVKNKELETKLEESKEEVQMECEEAEKAFDDEISNTSEKKYKERSYYNKGVAYIKEKKLQESIDAWKIALKLDPADEDARFNLQKALTEQKKGASKDQKQQQQQQKQQQQKQKQNNKLDKKKIEQYLKSLEQKEQEVQRKFQESRARGVTQPEKDW